MTAALSAYHQKLTEAIAAVRAGMDSGEWGGSGEAVAVLEKAGGTAEFLGLNALVAPGEALAAALAAVGPPGSTWDDDVRARVAGLLNDYSAALDAIDLKAQVPAARPISPDAPPAVRAAERPGGDASDSSDTPSTSPGSGVESIPVGAITVGDRLRGTNEASIGYLAQSMEAIGLRTPVTVVADGTESWLLVAGFRRLAAARRLGWEAVPAFVMEPEGIPAALWEIDENLIRVELTRLEKDQHLLRRKEIFDAGRQLDTGRSSPGVGGRGITGFASDTEAETGMSKRSINEALYRASHISQAVQDQLMGQPVADSAVELNALSRLDEAQQEAAVEMLRNGQVKTLRRAAAKLRGRAGAATATNLALKRMILAWNTADSEARLEFLKWLVSNGAMDKIPVAGAAEDDGGPADDAEGDDTEHVLSA
jgi:ParB family chromosome partitioning protein